MKRKKNKPLNETVTVTKAKEAYMNWFVEEMLSILVTCEPLFVVMILAAVDTCKKRYRRHKQIVEEYRRFEKERDYWLDYDLTMDEYIAEHM